MKWGVSDEVWAAMSAAERAKTRREKRRMESITARFLYRNDAFLSRWSAKEWKARRTGTYRNLFPDSNESPFETIVREVDRAAGLRKTARKHRKIRRRAAKAGLSLEQYAMKNLTKSAPWRRR